MFIITDNDRLLEHVPNVLAHVEGERSLFDKIHPWLTIAEQWVIDTFTGNETLQFIASDETSSVWAQTASVIVCEALQRAIPSLDLVLTPNGFGIVSNQNVAPASKERVERLISTLKANRDYAINLLLDSLQYIDSWQDSKQRSWFAATLLQSPRACKSAIRNPGSLDEWELFCASRVTAMNIESAIAEEFISPELMIRLRLALISHDASNDDLSLALRVRDCVLHEVDGKRRDVPALNRIVNFIRKYPDHFPEWVNSDTAKLFAPPVFENKKQSSGYFF
ncbi:DUF6712 family protein [Sodaliphilus sp.]|uniref:DUF6712 family protein n=1 Tax=Sodaliphilus sp. TaxID=2815818 RepID=UPI00388F4D99